MQVKGREANAWWATPLPWVCVCARQSTGWWTADEGVACRSGKELNKRLSHTAFITLGYIGNILTPPYAAGGCTLSGVVWPVGQAGGENWNLFPRRQFTNKRSRARPGKGRAELACVCVRKGPFSYTSIAEPSRKIHSRAAGTGLNFSDLPSAGDDSGLSGRLPAICRIDFFGAISALGKQFLKRNSPLFIALFRIKTFALGWWRDKYSCNRLTFSCAWQTTNHLNK